VASRITRLDLATWGGFATFATSSVVTPVCLPEISGALSTSLSEGGGMETARTFVVLSTLVLAGVCAQKWGKRRFLSLGQLAIASGLLMASFSESYLSLILSLMVVGVGGGFTEALINPLVVDLHPADSGRYLNITNAFYPVGVMASAFIFGELLTLGYSWRLVYRTAAAGALGMGLLFSTSRFPAAAADSVSAWATVRRILVLPGFWVLAAAIFLGAGVESAFTFWSRSFVATSVGGAPRAGALAVVIFAGAMAAGRLLAARLTAAYSLRAIMAVSALLGAGVSSLVPFVDGLAGYYGLLVLAGLAAASFWPSILSVAADRLDVETTMLFVLLACAGIAGFGSIPWAIGLVGDAAGLRAGLAVIPAVFIALMLVLYVERRTAHCTPARGTG